MVKNIFETDRVKHSEDRVKDLTIDAPVKILSVLTVKKTAWCLPVGVQAEDNLKTEVTGFVQEEAFSCTTIRSIIKKVVVLHESCLLSIEVNCNRVFNLVRCLIPKVDW